MLEPASVGLAALAVLASCDTDRRVTMSSVDPSPAVLAQSGAAERIAALRERFRITVNHEASEPAGIPAQPVPEPIAVIGAGIATIEPQTGRETLRVRLPSEALRRVARTARVELPVAATGYVRLEDDASRLSLRFALQGAVDSPVAVADGLALYAGALAGADVVHRAHAEGTEDFVVFERRPAREDLRYTVDVSRVAGLRLVSNTLEFLDDGGAPRLRVPPPYVVDASGTRHDATIGVEGCAYDENPAAPWGRPVTRPGEAWCTIRVTWHGVAYPAVVDPAWTATGSMADVRVEHTASVLASGQVLIAGGFPVSGPLTSVLATAELYDPASGTFSATGLMAEGRRGHTASVLASGMVLVAGAWCTAPACGLSATAELYDPTDGTFSYTGPMLEGRALHTASVLLSGSVLLAGGETPSSMTAEVYDPVAGTFSATGPLLAARDGHTASVLASGNVLVAGGGGASGTTAEVYDPMAGTFSATGPMLEARYDHTASVLASGSVLVAGGDASGTTAEVYDPVAGTFTATGPMAQQHGTASILSSGEVLVAGLSADAQGQPILTAELYDPVSGTFSPAEPMVEPRIGHTASVLLTGDVLVAGGYLGPNPFPAPQTPLASAELYELDPSAGEGGAGGAGQAGQAPVGGASPGGASAGGASEGGGGGAPDEEPRGGCNCRHSGSSSQAPLGAFGIALAIAAWAWRRQAGPSERGGRDQSAAENSFAARSGVGRLAERGRPGARLARRRNTEDRSPLRADVGSGSGSPRSGNRAP